MTVLYPTYHLPVNASNGVNALITIVLGGVLRRGNTHCYR